MCFIFFVGYVTKPSDREAYSKGYTDAVKDIVYLEKNDLTEKSMSLLHITALFFYNDGINDGTKLNNLITKIIIDENISEEIENYYVDKYNELWSKDTLHIDELHYLIKELEEVLNSKSL